MLKLDNTGKAILTVSIIFCFFDFKQQTEFLMSPGVRQHFKYKIIVGFLMYLTGS